MKILILAVLVIRINVVNIDFCSLKLSDNHSIHVIYKRPQNPGKSADTLETAMLAQGVC